MKLKILMVINAIVATVFGILFVVVPTRAFSWYGVMTAAPPLIYMGQLFGAALIGFGVLTWHARNSADNEARRAITLALFIGHGVGFIVALLGQLGGIVNNLGWSTVVIYFFFALGFGYFRFIKTTS